MLRSDVKRDQDARNPHCGAMVAVCLALCGCSALVISPTEKEVAPVGPVVPDKPPSDYVYPLAHLAGDPDLTLWEQLTATPTTLPYIECRGWADVLLLPEPPQPGAWRLVDVTEVYRPILDIVADRTGMPVSSNNVYYHFQLHIDEE